MKYSASKWPITIIYEIADDWFDGIDKENLNDVSVEELVPLHEAVDEAAELFVKAKGQILARQEAKRKQNNSQSQEQ